MDEGREDGQFWEDGRPLVHPLEDVARGDAVPPLPAAAAFKDARVASILGYDRGLLDDVVERDHCLPQGEPDPVDEPVEDHTPAEILLLLLHGHVEPNHEGGRPDPGESGTTDLVAGGWGAKG